MYLSKVIWRYGSGTPVPPAPAPYVASTFNCAPAVAVGDAVYVTPGPPLTVNKAWMVAGVGQTPEAIGIVISKPTAITCDVVMYGLAVVPFPLVQGAIYYVSNLVAGGITTAAPAAAGEKQQRIGIAASGTMLVVNPTLASVLL